MPLSEMVKKIEKGVNGRSILLEGPTGVGKSFQARSLLIGEPPTHPPSKVLVLSTENKLTSMEDLEPEVVTVTNFDYPDPRDKPEMRQAFLTDAGVNVYRVLHALRTEPHDYDVLYFDSIMRWMLELVWHIGRTNTNPDARSDYSLFKRKGLFMLGHLGSLTDATLMEKPMTVVGTCGIETEMDALDNTKKLMAAIDGTKIAPLIGHYFDDVFMLRGEPGEGGATKYVAYTQANYNFDAKSSGLVKLPPKIENPNLFRIIRALRGELAVKK